MQPTRQNRLSHRRCREGKREGPGIKEGEGGDRGALCGKVVERGGEEGKKRRKEEMGGEGQGRGVL